MASDTPIDAAGRPLRQGAGAVQQPADRWAEWTRWGQQVNQSLQSKVDQAALDRALAHKANIKDVNAGILVVIKQAAAAIKEERAAREALATSCQAAVSELEARIIALETGGGRSAPALSEAETAALKGRLQATLAVGLNELAAQRLAVKKRPPRPNGSTPS